MRNFWIYFLLLMTKWRTCFLLEFPTFTRASYQFHTSNSLGISQMESNINHTPMYAKSDMLKHGKYLHGIGKIYMTKLQQLNHMIDVNHSSCCSWVSHQGQKFLSVKEGLNKAKNLQRCIKSSKEQFSTLQIKTKKQIKSVLGWLIPQSK